MWRPASGRPVTSPAVPPAEIRASLLRGALVALGGLLLAALALYVVGPMQGVVFNLAAGLLALAGLTGIVLGVFVWILPAILPAK